MAGFQLVKSDFHCLMNYLKMLHFHLLSDYSLALCFH